MHVATSPLVRQQTQSLLGELAQVLNRHPAGAAFRLLYAPADLDLPEDTVLVQTVNTDRGILELRPRQISDLRDADLLHMTQVLDPSDTALSAHAEQLQAASCHATQRPDGSTGHWYW
ncbi:hypothetical protein [Streptomyces sp. NPDC004629]|uniref:hypothetical protein n=1 Tax=Streptomyces sp. NPDC004629 TaxID=3364705 RepID=UPI0036AF0123